MPNKVKTNKVKKITQKNSMSARWKEDDSFGLGVVRGRKRIDQTNGTNTFSSNRQNSRNTIAEMFGSGNKH
jgi:hypothetical protein